MNNFVLTKDNIFSEIECKDIINFCKNKTIEGDFNYLNYKCYDFPNSHFLFDRIKTLIQEYKTKYPEIDKTASIWDLTSLRFKHFEVLKVQNENNIKFKIQHLKKSRFQNLTISNYQILNFQMFTISKFRNFEI